MIICAIILIACTGFMIGTSIYADYCIKRLERERKKLKKEGKL